MKLMLIFLFLIGCCTPIVIMPDEIYESIDDMSEDFGARQYKESVIMHLRDLGAVENINRVDSIYVIVKELYDAY